VESISSCVPRERIRVIGEKNVRADGAYVLYWMVASRRSAWNHALDRAVDHAEALGRPLVVLEALRCAYPYASDRHHRYVLDGMADNAAAFVGRATYLPYVEPQPGAGRGLVEALAAQACVVITDDAPVLFLRRMVEAAGRRSPVRVEAVDSCGVVPLSVVPKTFDAARWYRSFLQKEGVAWVTRAPGADPVARLSRREVVDLSAVSDWPAASPGLLAGTEGLDAFPIDHAVKPVRERGGREAGRAALQRFVSGSLAKYGDRKRSLEKDGTSGLSGYLHWGHLSAHEVFAAVADEEGWDSTRLSKPKAGIREGFWGISEPAEVFVDELLVWRELAWSWAHFRPDWAAYASLPEWARRTLEAHAEDRRQIYTFEELRDARTEDPLWNAAQRQLRVDGRIASYLRMLWGKRIVEWTESPQRALEIMLELNDRYAVDGRDPNSVAGVTWVLGRFDRPWPPDKPILGTLRPMSSRSTATKMDIQPYLKRYGPGALSLSP
jgi:deoxyribodipyrimidine photo-lyase